MNYLSLSGADRFANVCEGLDEIVSLEDAILVDIHDAESLLELLDGGLAEEVEDVLFLAHGGVWCYTGDSGELRWRTSDTTSSTERSSWTKPRQ